MSTKNFESARLRAAFDEQGCLELGLKEAGVVINLSPAEVTVLSLFLSQAVSAELMLAASVFRHIAGTIKAPVTSKKKSKRKP